MKSSVFRRLGRAVTHSGIFVAAVVLAVTMSTDPGPKTAHNGFVFPRNLDLDSLQKVFDATSIFDSPAAAIVSVGFSDQDLAGCA